VGFCVEEYDHSTPNLIDNLAVGIGDKIPSWAVGLENFFKGKFLLVVEFLRRSQGFLPSNRRIYGCKIFGGGAPLLEKFNGEAGIWGAISCP